MSLISLDLFYFFLPSFLLKFSSQTPFQENNIIYEECFPGWPVRHAVYTHAYDFSGTRLLIGGGPLAFGLKGCYVGLW